MSSSPQVLSASPGDQLVIRGHHTGEPDRDGEILEVLGENGAPPYRVRWEDDGHVSELFPGSDAHVRHLEHKRQEGRAKSSGR
ncbi:MAG: DUF1918 domain-containing protein [Solirubrobacterales bacterium]